MSVIIMNELFEERKSTTMKAPPRSSIVITTTTKVLSPIVFLSVSISITCITIFLSSNQRYCYLYNIITRFAQDNGCRRQQTIESNEANHQQEAGGGDKLSEHKTVDVFVWSSEFNHWTLRQNSSSVSFREQVKFENGVKTQVQSCVWPDDDCKGKLQSSDQDRIVNQLRLDHQSEQIYKILPPDYSYPIGQDVFLREECLVDRCEITYNNQDADALIFQNSDVLNEPPKSRRKDQIWIAYLLESPFHTFDKRFSRLYRGKHQFNWTATYRTDSDIVTPYSKFVPYEDQVNRYQLLLRQSRQQKNRHINKLDNSLGSDTQQIYANSSAHHKSLIRGKTGKVAWFASNCNAANNRLEYARELSKYIQVDIYGKCGNLTCDKWNQTGCFNMIKRRYKFYLSFENSNCRQYITEKLYKNAYGHNDLDYLVLPIVMGAARNDYEELVPAGSFIHVDDFGSAKELADYLILLDANDTLYYSYFIWKTKGRFVDTKFMCRVCALLHESNRSGKNKSYSSIKNWWNTYETISGGSTNSCDS